MDDFTAELIAGAASPASVEVATSSKIGRDSYFDQPPTAPSAAEINNSSSGATSNTNSGTFRNTRRGFRGRISALKDKAGAGLQDRLVEKLLQHVIPEEDEDGLDDNEHGEYDDDVHHSKESHNHYHRSPEEPENLDATIDDDFLASRPNFNITTMSNNFRRFNARIGVVFRFQVRVIRLITWRHASHTLSFLAIYTFVCLDPYLFVLLPLAALLLGVLIPSFMARHPPLVSSPHHSPPGYYNSALQSSLSSTAANTASGTGNGGVGGMMEYSPRGPPLAPARTVKPVKDFSRDFFRNMRDLQNSMEDFSVAHDAVVALVVPATNFSDERLSSAVFVVLLAAFLLLSITAHLIPWRLAALVSGWVAVVSGHPAMKRLVATIETETGAGETKKEVSESLAEETQSALQKFAAADIMLDVAPETREVEIFELQRRNRSDGLAVSIEENSVGKEGDGALLCEEWEPWLFTSSPYDPLSAMRIAGEKPRGTRFFEDVRPPEGWDWSEKKWALDLWSRDWVEERIITAVEVETEGERWVYDMISSYDTRGKEGEPVVIDHSARQHDARAATLLGGPSWEEAVESEAVGRRGEWRRRRWVRLVKRKVVGSGEK